MRASFSALALALLGASAPALADDCSGWTRSREVTVGSSSQLAGALAAARPGTLIRLEPGTYAGRFVATAQGTATEPITLCGPRTAILDGGSTSTGYTLHLKGARHWNVAGFTVQRGKNGVMLDGAYGNRLDGLLVRNVGHAGIHLRKHSKSNTVVYNEVRDTGRANAGYGEGLYIGSAYSNWKSVTGSSTKPDRSSYNKVRYNHFGPGITAEAIDVKEGTQGGRIEGNTFDGTGMTGANYGDSWMDVKGNDYVIAGNSGVGTLRDGFQVHVAYPGWGHNNTFTDNIATLNAAGTGFMVHSKATGTVVKCDNVVLSARLFSNVGCQP